MDQKSNTISFSNVSKSIGLGEQTQWIVRSASGVLQPGHIVLLTGPSGCGKTTLLSLLSGMLSLTTGTITMFGCELSSMTEEEKNLLRRHNMGFIFQNYNLVPTLTVQQNVAIPLLAQCIPRKKALSQASEILSSLEMESFIFHYPNQISGGQQQRVAIGRALVHNPRFILCDEPTAALDEASGQNVMRILKTLAASTHRIVLIVTHDPRIYPYGDRILEMREGIVTTDTESV